MSKDNMCQETKTVADIGHDAWHRHGGTEGSPPIPLSSRAPEYQEAWHAAANAILDHAIEECFHDEQISVWGEEFIGELAMIGHINPDTSYDDVVDVHQRFQSFMKDFVLPRIRRLKGNDNG